MRTTNIESVNVAVIAGHDADISVELLRGLRLREIRVFSNQLANQQKWHKLRPPRVFASEVPSSISEFKRAFRGVDVVLGGDDMKTQHIAAFAASEIGAPFITWGIVTVILPDGYAFDELEFSCDPNMLLGDTAADQPLRWIFNSVVRAYQVMELFNLFTGIGEPTFAPFAWKFSCIPNITARKIELSIRRLSRRLNTTP